MAQKYSVATNPHAFYMALPVVGTAASGICQLSDGTPVWVDNTTGASSSRLVMSTDRASTSIIASGLPVAMAWNSYSNTNVNVCRDASDNLYVVGSAVGNDPAVSVIPFIKGSGKTWTRGTTFTFSPVGGINFTTAARWANTGGGLNGAGHLVLNHFATAQNTHAIITIEAGKLLAGTAAVVSNTVIGPTTSNGSGATDLEPDGFGGTTFATLVESGASDSKLQLATFSVSAGGAVTIGSWMSGSLNAISYAGSQPAILIRFAPGTWALVAAQNNNLGSTWIVITFNASGFIRGGDGVGSGNVNAVNNVTWGASKTPGQPRLLIYSLSNNPGADAIIFRTEITPSAASSTSSSLYAAGVADDTISGSSAYYSGSSSPRSPRLRATREQSGGFVDWQVCIPDQNNANQFYSFGDYTAFNAAPTAATPTTPAAGSTVDRTQPITLAWVFNDPNVGDSQSKSDIRYRLTSASTWTTILGATTTATSYALPANQAAGNYEWQVLTYDSQGVASPWSSSSFFTAADPPGVPVITAPSNGGTIATASYTVTWSSPTQEAYEVRRVADNAGSPNTGTVYFTTGTVVDGTSRARTLTFDTNNRTEHVQVRVRYSGIWSQWADARVLVSYTPPATPVVTLTVQDATASILVTITNPTPSGSQPTVASHDILIDDGFGEGLTRRVTGWAPGAAWTYWLPRGSYDYVNKVQVVAVATNGTTSSALGT